MVTVSVIGCGNQGSALVKGLARAESDFYVVACDRNDYKLERLETYADETTDDKEVAADADIVFVAVKPSDTGGVLDALDLSPEQVLVSVGAAVPLDFLADRTDATVVRVMPNLAAEYDEMAATVAAEDGVPDEVRDVLDELGVFVEVDEGYMDISTAINGSGPAFVFYLIRAFRESGVESGLDRDDAESLAAQTFKGAAETVLNDERTVDELINAVCSPGGTTIEGMRVLRESTVEDDIVEAVDAAEERSEEISCGFEPEAGEAER